MGVIKSDVETLPDRHAIDIHQFDLNLFWQGDRRILEPPQWML
jgi:hypothetical protein